MRILLYNKICININNIYVELHFNLHMYKFLRRNLVQNLKRHKDEDLLKGQAVKNQKVWLPVFWD